MPAEAPVLERVDCPATSRRARLRGVDALRGLAVLLMIGDHLLVVGGHADSPVRLTVTRLSMSLFAFLAGHLVTRLSWRWPLAAATGLVLPTVVPWIDSPNILVLLALGAALIVWVRRAAPPLAAGVFVGVILLALTWYTNGLHTPTGGAYSALGVAALMCAGALVPREVVARLTSRLPALLAPCGRFPLAVYVGHLLLLQLFVWWTGA